MQDGCWHLTLGGEVIAVLHFDGQSLVPELDGHFTVEAAYELVPAFESVRQLFEREIAILDLEDEESISEWMDIWDELKAPGLFVESPDGKDRWDILWIHFQNKRAWWWPLFDSPQTRLKTRSPP